MIYVNIMIDFLLKIHVKILHREIQLPRLSCADKNPDLEGGIDRLE